MESETHRPLVSVIVDGAMGPGARHGLNKLRLALQAAGVTFEETGGTETARGMYWIVAGVTQAKTVANLLKKDGLDSPEAPESVLIHHTPLKNAQAVLVSGGDDRGLMYALLDVADGIERAPDRDDPLDAVPEVLEQPVVRERSVSIYTMQSAHFEQRFHNPDYWARYLDLLAQCRFNTFTLLFAYESAGYFAPPYPYFFDVETFPEVHVTGLTHRHQQRNLASLNRLIAMTHDRGLDFSLGIWDHIYRGGVQQGPGQDPENPLPWRVAGVTTDNLMTYSVDALTALLRRVPNLDTIQFRMHGESGLTGEEMDDFWMSIYQVMHSHGQGIRFDARAKGFPDRLIDRALDEDIPIRICTKYWMEQMGLPFHPTHIHPKNQMDRRHSYADLLRYPKKYPILWRLWNGGTNRVLLWGDPEYVRRFVGSTQLYEGDGFDVNEPLATKMASQDHDATPFELLNPAYRYYDYEFERYWRFFQVFGRVGYNPDTATEAWDHTFERRFGHATAPHVRQGLQVASRILPMIVAYNYPYNLFPTTRGWVEKQRMEDLPDYAAALPSDTEQFMSFAEAAEAAINGNESGKRHPLDTAVWFDRIGDEVLAAADEADRHIGDNRSNEYIVTMTDLRILACLAKYHARRIHAGLAWALFQRTHDVTMLDDAIGHEEHAIEAWSDLVDTASDVYTDDLMMGRPEAGLSGHWRDELDALRQGVDRLRQHQADSQPGSSETTDPVGGRDAAMRVAVTEDTDAPTVTHTPITCIEARQPLVVTAKISDPSGIKWARVRYRNVTQYQDFRTVDMAPADQPDVYKALIPVEHLDPAFDIMYSIEVMDHAENGTIYPDLLQETPYIVVHLDRQDG